MTNRNQIPIYLFHDYWSNRNNYHKNRITEDWNIELGRKAHPTSLSLNTNSEGTNLYHGDRLIVSGLREPWKRKFKVFEEAKLTEGTSGSFGTAQRFVSLVLMIGLSIIALALLGLFIGPVNVIVPLSEFEQIVIQIGFKETSLLNIMGTSIVISLCCSVIAHKRLFAKLLGVKTSAYRLLLGVLLIALTVSGPPVYVPREIIALLMGALIQLLVGLSMVVLTRYVSRYRYFPDSFLILTCSGLFVAGSIIGLFVFPTGDYPTETIFLVFGTMIVASSLMTLFTEFNEPYRVNLYLYDGEPTSSYFPCLTKDDSPYWLKNRYYWVFRLIYCWTWEASFPPRRDYERLEVWVNSCTAEAEWVVSDFHYRELWYQIPDGSEYIILRWDPTFHTILPISETDLVHTLVAKKRAHLLRDQRAVESKYAKLFQTVTIPYTILHPRHRVKLFFKGIEKISAGLCADLPWRYWRYAYGAYPSRVNSSKWERYARGYGAAIDQFSA